ncbi:MAG: hypothetical protein AUK47_24450 [Deltaproteobacteria bacterium CG2_30_63_29]|nr:MAG: hypothetical protein AUK47_24450 [Deltaproteobacteria bacterium CG2_30_63_29]
MDDELKEALRKALSGEEADLLHLNRVLARKGFEATPTKAELLAAVAELSERNSLLEARVRQAKRVDRRRKQKV